MTNEELKEDASGDSRENGILHLKGSRHSPFKILIVLGIGNQVERLIQLMLRLMLRYPLFPIAEVRTTITKVRS